jgi:hypothetical protein
MEDENNIRYCCSECGGTNIQVRAWIDTNTNKYISDIDDGECWCADCMDYTKIEEYEVHSN